MKLNAKIRLNPTPKQHDLLMATLERANVACNHISTVAWENKVFSRVPVHKLTYADVREQFELSAQVTVRCIGKVVDAYKVGKKRKRKFKLRGAIAYDNRILTYKTDKQVVSIWTLNGRETIPYLAGDRQHELLQHQQGESDLAYIKGKWFLFATCDVEAPTEDDVTEYLGVDLGVKNIAVTSDGEIFKGNHVNNVRIRYVKIRKKLQKKGTKSAKRLLKKRNRKETRFANDVNHSISKQLVKKAKDTHRGIALEDLKGITKRVTARKSQRVLLYSWAFGDLQNKISYKAEMYGVSVVLINPAYTSQQCSQCGCIDKKNRKTQEHFECVECGYVAHADYNASLNIRARASVNKPHAVA